MGDTGGENKVKEEGDSEGQEQDQVRINPEYRERTAAGENKPKPGSDSGDHDTVFCLNLIIHL